MSKNHRILTLLLAVLLISSGTILPSYAVINDEPETIMPFWTNASNVIVDLKKASGKVVITITVNGLSGTKFSSGEVALLKTSGTNTGLVKSWDRLYSNSATYVFTDNSTTATSGTYKVNFSIKALRNGVGETISGSDTLTV